MFSMNVILNIPVKLFLRILSIVILFTNFSELIAQNSTLYGKVYDENNAGIEGVEIDVKNNEDSSFINQTKTDSMGNFTISTNVKTNLLIVAKHTNYKLSTQLIKVKYKDEFIYFKLVSDKINLKDVKISAAKPMFEFKAGTTIFNVENNTSLSGIDGLNLLKKIPGVQIKNNQIGLVNKGPLAVMINGRLQLLSSEDVGQMLQSMTSDQIAKIELNTAPSSKFDAEGNNGIINIITRKSTKDGLKGSVNMGYNQNHFGSPSLGTQLLFKKNKMNVTFNASGNQIGWLYTANYTTLFTKNKWEQIVKNQMMSRTARIQMGFEYSINAKNSIGLTYTNSNAFISNDELTIARNVNEQNDILDSVITFGKTRDKYLSKHALNFNFEHRFDSLGKKVNLDYDVYTHTGSRSRNYDIYDFSKSFNNITNNLVFGKPYILIQTIKADVEYPTNNFKLTFGIKGSFIRNFVDNQFQNWNGSIFIDDLSKSNSFDYNENTQAGYMMLNKSGKKIEFSLGIRAEHTFVKGYSSTLLQTNFQDYTKLFPWLNFQYNFNTNNSLTFMALRRIKRPDYSQLNPFRFYYTPNAYTEGNPILQPSISHILQLDYIYKSRLTFSIAYVHNDNYFDRIFILDSAVNSSNITRKNIGNTNYIEWSILYNLNPLKCWDVSGNFNLAYNAFYPYIQVKTLDFAAFNAWLNINNTFYFNPSKTIVGELNAYFYSPRQKDYKTWNAMTSINVGIRFLLMNKNLSISINGDDLSAGTYWYQTNQLNGTQEYSYDDERSLRLAVSYKFGNKKLKSGKSKTTNEEILRIN